SGGVLSGNTVQAPINIPITACGTEVLAIALGASGNDADCGGGSNGAPAAISGDEAAETTGKGPAAVAGGESAGGVLSGNTVQAPINIPITACGTDVLAIALGATGNDADCGGGSNGAPAAVAGGESAGGVLSGNTVQAPINIPITACGTEVHAITLGTSGNDADCGGGSNGAPAAISGDEAAET